jgi:putative peptidoglycan lipid II flippase
VHIGQLLSPPENPAQVNEPLAVARSAGIVSIATLLSRLTGLAREIFMAQFFGAGYLNDAFQLGFRIPNLTRDLFAEGALSAAFIPTFTAAWKTEGKQEAAELANVVFTATALVVSAVAALGCWFAPELVELLAPGFAQVAGKFHLAVVLTRIMFPFLVFIALAALASGMLNSAGRFGRAATASVFFNIGSLAVGILLGFVAGPHIGISRVAGMAWGVTAGGLLQLLWQMPAIYRGGFSFRLNFNWSHPGLKAIVMMMLPAIVTSVAVQANVVVTSVFASGISDPIRGLNGPVSWLTYAFRMVHLPLGLFGVAIASAMLPSISRNAAVRDLLQFRITVAHSLALILLLTLPSSMVLVLLSRPLIGAVYQGGRFNAYDTDRTALALACYALGLTAYAAARLLGSTFYALSDARKPMYVSLVSVAFNIALPFLLIGRLHFGFFSLALTTAAASILECLLLAEMLRRRLGGINGYYLLDRMKRIAAACALTLIPLALLYRLMASLTDGARAGYLLQLAACLPVAALGFWLSFRLFRVSELSILEEMFIRPLRQGWAATHAKLRV